jgi:hypothetical protein
LASFDGPGLAIALEGSVAVLEELLLPAREHIATDPQFIADIEDMRLLEKVAFENGDFLRTERMATGLVQGKPPPRSY